MTYLSPRSTSLIEQHRAEFVKDFKATVISDTVKRIIAASVPIKVENDKSELVDDAHVEELNNLITKSAKDLTDEAIKGKMVKTNFGDNEVPSNFLDAVAQSAEGYIERESIQRANWFKLQIENDRIPDASKDYNNFETKLKLTFQKINFSVEDFDRMAKEQMDIAKSFEEENIIEEIKDTVIGEINDSETRQNKIVEIMQEVQDTKKEYESDLEENTSGTDDMDVQPISDDQEVSTDAATDTEIPDVSVDNNSGDSSEGILFKQKGSQADKLASKIERAKAGRGAEDANMNENQEKNDNSTKDGKKLNGGNGAEGMGAMGTYQNADNFPSPQPAAIGIGGGYNGPTVDDLGTGVLDADENDLVEEKEVVATEDTEEEAPESDGNGSEDVENPANQKPTPDAVGSAVSQVPNLDADSNSNETTTVNEDGETVEYTDHAEDAGATIEVDPVMAAETGEIDNDAKPEEANKTLEALAAKMMPLSLMKLERTGIYSKEDMTKLLTKLGDQYRGKFAAKLDTRLVQVEDLIRRETADTTKVKAKFDKFTSNYKAALEEAQSFDLAFATMGLNSNRITDKNSLFALSVAKNILNRSSRRKNKNIKLSRILDDKDYGKSMENLVDYIFSLSAIKRNLDKSQNIEQSLESIAQHEEKINGAIYELNADDKERASTLQNMLGRGKLDHYFVYDNLLLDFNNNLTRVSEDQEEAPINVISDAVFTNKVLDKLENKGFERTASLESLVKHIVKGDVDPIAMNPSLYERILLAYGKKQALLSQESLMNDVENSKIATKAKVLLTIRRSAEALNIANEEFIKSFDEMFSYNNIA